MMNNSDNPELICRSCTRVLSRHKYHLLETPLLVDLYKRLSATHLESNDPLPKSICSACNQRLKDFDIFQTKCIESYKSLLLRFPTIVDLKLENGDGTVKEEQTDNEISFTENLEELATSFDDDFKYEDDPLSADDKEVGDTKIEDNTNTESKKDPINSDDEPLINCRKERSLKSEAHNSPQSVRIEPKTIRRKSVTKSRTKTVKERKTKKINGEQNKKQNARFACNQCSRTFTEEYIYEAHVRRHQGLRPYGCKFCDRSFLKNLRLKEHILVRHTENPILLQCTVEGCKRSYKCKSDLSKHIKSHSKPRVIKPNPQICELCGKTFRQNWNLQRHILVHQGVYPFECDICPRKFRSQKELKVHKLKHEGIKNFACEICGLKKTTKHELTTHMNVHTREKTYPCGFCDKSFLSLARANQHRNVVHLGVRNFPCSYCDQRFGKAETLKHHEMTHTGEKPHECPICQKRFIQKTSFQYHVRRHETAAST